MFDQCQSETLQDVVIWSKQDSAVLFVWIESGGWTSHSGSTSCQVGTKATKGPHWPFFGAQSLTNYYHRCYAISIIIKNHQESTSTNCLQYKCLQKSLFLLGEQRVFFPSSSDVFLQEISVAFQLWDLFALDLSGFVPVAHGHDGLMELLLFEAFRLLVMWDPCEALRPWGRDRSPGSYLRFRFLGSSQKPLKKTIQNLHCLASMSFNAVWLESEMARFHLRRAEWFTLSQRASNLLVFGNIRPKSKNHPAGPCLYRHWASLMSQSCLWGRAQGIMVVFLDCTKIASQQLSSRVSMSLLVPWKNPLQQFQLVK